MNKAMAHVEELVDVIRDHVSAEEPGPDTDDPVGVGFYWFNRYFEQKGYTHYRPEQSAKPDVAKLAERGWFRAWRAPSIVDPTRRPPMPKKDPLSLDTVARAIRDASYLPRTLVKTPQELLEAAREEAGEGASAGGSAPADARALHDHLVKIAPALQTRHAFWDVDRANWYLMVFGELPLRREKVCRPGYLRTEYWENARTGDGLWAFTACRAGTRETADGAVPSVWYKVKILEKISEVFGDPVRHAATEYESAEVRRALEKLYWVDIWASVGG